MGQVHQGGLGQRMDHGIAAAVRQREALLARLPQVQVPQRNKGRVRHEIRKLLQGQLPRQGVFRTTQQGAAEGAVADEVHVLLLLQEVTELCQECSRMLAQRRGKHGVQISLAQVLQAMAASRGHELAEQEGLVELSEILVIQGARMGGAQLRDFLFQVLRIVDLNLRQSRIQELQHVARLRQPVLRVQLMACVVEQHVAQHPAHAPCPDRCCS